MNEAKVTSNADFVPTFIGIILLNSSGDMWEGPRMQDFVKSMDEQKAQLIGCTSFMTFLCPSCIFSCLLLLYVCQ